MTKDKRTHPSITVSHVAAVGDAPATAQEFRATPKNLKIIITTVASEYRVAIKDINNLENKTKPVVQARRVATYFCQELTGAHPGTIANAFRRTKSIGLMIGTRSTMQKLLESEDPTIKSLELTLRQQLMKSKHAAPDRQQTEPQAIFANLAKIPYSTPQLGTALFNGIHSEVERFYQIPRPGSSVANNTELVQRNRSIFLAKKVTAYLCSTVEPIPLIR